MRLTVLARNAGLKTRKWFVFWASMLLYTGILLIVFGGAYLGGRRSGRGPSPFVLPDAWSLILRGPSILPLMFGSLVLILLVSSEFSWRTARQNVIDGLSKDELFVEKLLFVPFVVLLFLGMYLSFAFGFAYAGTDRTALVGPLISAVQLRQVGGLALAAAGYASGALFFALAIRNPGVALGGGVIYVVLESLVRGAFIDFSASLGQVTKFFPANVFNHLMHPIEFDPVAYQQLVAAMARRPDLPMDYWGAGLVPAALAWIAVLLAAAFFWFRKRDL